VEGKFVGHTKFSVVSRQFSVCRGCHVPGTRCQENLEPAPWSPELTTDN
jgi:hypothetical protein